MKKALLYLFLFSYATIILKPVFPSIGDTIAHICWYSEHMATVHYENGKYHVHHEYQQAAKNSNPVKEASLPKAPSDNEHLVILEIYSFAMPPDSVIRFFCFSSSFSSIHVTTDFPPPKA